jgi:hypothetical protein
MVLRLVGAGDGVEGEENSTSVSVGSYSYS